MNYRERLEEQEARKKKENSAYSMKVLGGRNVIRGIRYLNPFSIIFGLFGLFTSRKMRKNIKK